MSVVLYANDTEGWNQLRDPSYFTGYDGREAYLEKLRARFTRLDKKLTFYKDELSELLKEKMKERCTASQRQMPSQKPNLNPVQAIRGMA